MQEYYLTKGENKEYNCVNYENTRHVINTPQEQRANVLIAHNWT